jgi:hypothetical protein
MVVCSHRRLFGSRNLSVPFAERTCLSSSIPLREMKSEPGLEAGLYGFKIHFQDSIHDESSSPANVPFALYFLLYTLGFSLLMLTRVSEAKPLNTRFCLIWTMASGCGLSEFWLLFTRRLLFMVV